MNLNSILIGSENPERLVDFYTKLFGKPTWNEGGYTGWMIGSGSVTVGPHDKVKGKNTSPGRIIWNIESPRREGRLRPLQGGGRDGDRGAVRSGGRAASGRAAIATFADPDDNYFQLMSPMPAEMPA